jgi:hypothetical protein
MLHKLLTVISLGMNLTLFAWYHDLDRKERLNSMFDVARFHAQNEAFGLHASAINGQSGILCGILDIKRAK